MTDQARLVLLAVFLLIADPLFGQNRQSQSSTRRPTEDRAPRVIFLTGSVLMDDDSLLDETLPVELVCNGSVLRQTKISNNGTFSFELGDNSSDNLSLTDATVSGAQGANLLGGAGGAGNTRLGVGTTAGGFRRAGLGRVDLSNCQVRLQPSAGFRSNSLRLSRRSVFDDPELGAIVVHRLGEDEGSTISLATLRAPKNAKRALARAGKELVREEPRLEEAEKHLLKALEIFPEFSAAHDLLGRLKLRQGDRLAAAKAFQKAVEAEPRFVNPYLELIRLALQKGDYIAAEPLVDQLAELKVQDPLGLYFHGLVKYNLKKYSEAEVSFSSLKENGGSQEFPQYLWLLGLIHWNQDKIPAAADDFRAFLDSAQGRIPPDITADVQKQLQEWESQGLAERTQKP